MLKRIQNYLELMRIKHWIKNALIILPLVFSGELFAGDKVNNAIIGFFAFSFLTSAVYILNDIHDAERDRLHEKKKHRPIASGKVSKKEGLIMLVLPLCLAIILNLQIDESFISFFWLILYALMNILYSRGLKDIPLVDILILVSGFLIRLIYGGVVTGIQISSWLYLTIIMASFYMGLGKRRNELGKEEKQIETRGVLRYYNYAFLDKNMYMCLGLAEAFYALWAIGTKNKVMLWTVPMLIIIGMKYSLNIEGDSDGDPVEVIVHDKAILILSLIYSVIVIGSLYLM